VAKPSSASSAESSAESCASSASQPAVHSRSGALVLLALVSLVWGVHWAVVKIGLGSMPPMTYGALRIAVGLGAAIGIAAARGRLRLPPREDLPIVASVGLLQIAGGVLIMNLALQVIPAGRSAVLVYTQPLWVAMLLAVVFRVPPLRNELVGLVLGIAGLVLLLNPAVIDWSSPAEVAGTLALLLNAVLWAGVSIHIRRHTWVASPLDLQPWQLLIALVPLAIAALVLERGASIIWGLPTVLILLYSGVLATAFASWGSQAITRSLGPQAAAIGFLAVPVIGLASGWLILGEQLGIADVVAFGLLLGGIAVTSLGPRRPNVAAPAEAPASSLTG
jgi:drug/metabolite transporter (DMT)-like permease